VARRPTTSASASFRPTRHGAMRCGAAPCGAVKDGILDFARRLRPRAEVPDLDELAPFGVYTYDPSGSLDAAVAAMRRYREVTIPRTATTR
jgi:hypothetical protein